jgi:hypothetical protein
MLDTREGDSPYLIPSSHLAKPHAAASLPGMIDMPALPALLRSARSRIRSRLAQIIAIAAASLPEVGV